MGKITNMFPGQRVDEHRARLRFMEPRTRVRRVRLCVPATWLVRSTTLNIPQTDIWVYMEQT